jgi:uncharacterized membrane protein
MYDGLRGFYARREGDKSSPGFSAAMALSFMCSVNVMALLIIGDVLTNGRALLTGWIAAHPLLLVLFGIGVAWVHIRIGKRAGIYNRSGPAESGEWRRYFSGYAVFTVVAFAACLATALSSRAT